MKEERKEREFFVEYDQPKTLEQARAALKAFIEGRGIDTHYLRDACRIVLESQRTSVFNEKAALHAGHMEGDHVEPHSFVAGAHWQASQQKQVKDLTPKELMENEYVRELLIALNEMKYQALRSYGTEEKVLNSNPFPWQLVFDSVKPFNEV